MDKWGKPFSLFEKKKILSFINSFINLFTSHDCSHLSVWMATPYGIVEVRPESHGEFYAGGSYILQWNFLTWAKGLKSLARYCTTPNRTGIGRENFVDFLWIGKESPVNAELASSFIVGGNGRRFPVIQAKLTFNGVRKMSIDETIKQGGQKEG